jgi:hypothetical protein
MRVEAAHGGGRLLRVWARGWGLVRWFLWRVEGLGVCWVSRWVDRSVGGRFGG